LGLKSVHGYVGMTDIQLSLKATNNDRLCDEILLNDGDKNLCYELEALSIVHMIGITSTCKIKEFNINQCYIDDLKFVKPSNVDPVPPILYAPYLESDTMNRVLSMNINTMTFNDLSYYGQNVPLIHVNARQVRLENIRVLDFNSDVPNSKLPDTLFYIEYMHPYEVEVFNKV
jgi:hypothetical protein